MFLEDSCERFSDAFDVGKDCKLELRRFVGSARYKKNIPTNSSGVGVGGGHLAFFLITPATIFMG